MNRNRVWMQGLGVTSIGIVIAFSGNPAIAKNSEDINSIENFSGITTQEAYILTESNQTLLSLPKQNTILLACYYYKGQWYSCGFPLKPESEQKMQGNQVIQKNRNIQNIQFKRNK
ncbi:hypothetical protein H6G80_01170 [Nostoc sp. FACHB-87]|uniref:hypothetical protein n=1 Tax=Nostocaceae TaxID=1162 RepID=UPI001683D3D6|nr:MULTISPECIES: hypothetical protein [Nostocaceae]MBD2452712.1 hypothetical protein [Nostoc sp. FACHB-87]MBD2473643.1 hypothetical protein [Anabaena sp. FACHB-83]